MNRIILTATALIGLALVAKSGFFEPATVAFKSKTSLSSAVERPQKPAKKSVPRHSPFAAVEVTDEALEELRKLSKLAKTAKPNRIYHSD